MTNVSQFPDGKFVALVEAAPDAMVCVLASGRIALVNAQVERLFGYRREELIGQPVEVLVPDAFRAVHRRLRTGYVADPQTRPMAAGVELAGLRRDGTTFPAEISLSAVDAGEGILVMAAIRDVTERRRAAGPAAQQAWIIQSSHDAVIGKTLEHVITSWNPGAERLYGYTAEEMIGRPIEGLILAEDRQQEIEVLAAVARGERVDRYQVRHKRKDGTTVDVSLSMSPIADRDGVIVGAASVARAVTEGQRADARVRGLLEAGPDAMLCVRADGRIALVNAEAERLFGYERDELVGQQVEMLVPDAVRDAHPGHRAGCTADPRLRPMGAGRQLAGRRRDASTFPADISLSAIDTDEGLFITVIVRDVTERQQVKNLERSNRDMEAFTYSVAHALRAPLRTLSGFSEALLEDYGDVLDEDGRNYAHRIVEATGQMATLIDDLLELSRLARAEVHLQPVDLGAEAAAITEELQRRGPDRRVRFAVQRPVQAQADPGLIRTVLQNLLENAWKFTSGHDDALIEFGATPAPDARLRCYVRDNGAGFDPAYSDKLFQPFQRLHTTREFPGTGVGLASVRQIVERHGGRVWAQGAVGQGATFYFTLGAEEIT